MRNSSLRARKTAPEIQKPGAFQCTLLRAFQLPPAYREVFLLKEIQGHTVAETAAILGIRIETALVRLKRARRQMSRFENSDATEYAT